MGLQEKYFAYPCRAFDVNAVKGAVITWCGPIDEDGSHDMQTRGDSNGPLSTPED